MVSGAGEVAEADNSAAVPDFCSESADAESVPVAIDRQCGKGVVTWPEDFGHFRVGELDESDEEVDREENLGSGEG